eukprot:scaffold23019_cov73-Skeletonema_marinoi.AAC.1
MFSLLRGLTFVGVPKRTFESYHVGLAGIREEGQAGRRDGCRIEVSSSRFLDECHSKQQCNVTCHDVKRRDVCSAEAGVRYSKVLNMSHTTLCAKYKKGEYRCVYEKLTSKYKFLH